MRTKKYTLKIWKSVEDWNDGNAFEERNLTDNDMKNHIMIIAGLNGQILSEEIYAFEIYERESGNTYYHSNEQ